MCEHRLLRLSPLQYCPHSLKHHRCRHHHHHHQHPPTYFCSRVCTQIMETRLWRLSTLQCCPPELQRHHHHFCCHHHHHYPSACYQLVCVQTTEAASPLYCHCRLKYHTQHHHHHSAYGSLCVSACTQFIEANSSPRFPLLLETSSSSFSKLTVQHGVHTGHGGCLLSNTAHANYNIIIIISILLLIIIIQLTVCSVCTKLS